MTKLVATAALVAAMAATMAIMASPSVAQTNAGSPAMAAPSHKARASVARASGQQARPLYNMAPGSAPVNHRDGPAFTGGGSLGYNQMIYNW